jgi:hypothetical protein
VHQPMAAAPAALDAQSFATLAFLAQTPGAWRERVALWGFARSLICCETARAQRLRGRIAAWACSTHAPRARMRPGLGACARASPARRHQCPVISVAGTRARRAWARRAWARAASAPRAALRLTRHAPTQACWCASG